MFSNNVRNIENEKHWKWLCDMKLLDQVCDVIQEKRYSTRTEQWELIG